MRSSVWTARFSRFLFLILLAAQCSAGPSASKQRFTEPESSTFLPLSFFPTTHIYADLDKDHIPDFARVTWRGGFKVIQVVFGDEQTLDLPITAEASTPGVLIAADIDRDCDRDLIWVPHHRALDPVIWLGSSGRRFEYAGDAGRYGRELARLYAGEQCPELSFVCGRKTPVIALRYRYAATTDERRCDYPSTASLVLADATPVRRKIDGAEFLPCKRGPPESGAPEFNL
jgi:hypothetical protein